MAHNHNVFKTHTLWNGYFGFPQNGCYCMENSLGKQKTLITDITNILAMNL